MFIKSPFRAPARHPVWNGDAFINSDIWCGTGQDRGKILIQKDTGLWVALNNLYPKIGGILTSEDMNLSNMSCGGFPAYVDRFLPPYFDFSQQGSGSSGVRGVLTLYRIDPYWIIGDQGIGFPTWYQTDSSIVQRAIDSGEYDHNDNFISWWRKIGNLSFGDNSGFIYKDGSDRSRDCEITLSQDVWKNDGSGDGIFGRYTPDESIPGNCADGDFVIGTAVWKNDELDIEIRFKNGEYDGAAYDSETETLSLVFDDEVYTSEEFDFYNTITFRCENKDDIEVDWVGFNGEEFKTNVLMFEVPSY